MHPDIVNTVPAAFFPLPLSFSLSLSFFLSLSFLFSFRSDCIELDFKEISYLVLKYFYTFLSSIKLEKMHFTYQVLRNLEANLLTFIDLFEFKD